jgi:hypothetical protein
MTEQPDSDRTQELEVQNARLWQELQDKQRTIDGLMALLQHPERTAGPSTKQKRFNFIFWLAFAVLAAVLVLSFAYLVLRGDPREGTPVNHRHTSVDPHHYPCVYGLLPETGELEVQRRNGTQNSVFGITPCMGHCSRCSKL